eukprot:snap_masked-scaffold_8-processed-gene-9.53-mRNA-1 protein AED:1.00 eAED:1.00 QI:0/0/0/0/1/1/2/0/62
MFIFCVRYLKKLRLSFLNCKNLQIYIYIERDSYVLKTTYSYHCWFAEAFLRYYRIRGYSFNF